MFKQDVAEVITVSKKISLYLVNNDGPADHAARVGRVKADDLVENDYVGFAAKKMTGKCYKMAPKIQKLA